jgi:TATA-box binding protein (TBP) (component of TFIID and TFIIIB)
MDNDIKKPKKTLTFPKFEDIPVSTKTFIVMTNLTFDIQKLFDFLPIVPYTIIPKKRGRKKKGVVSDPNKDIADGSILTLDLANEVRGVLFKKKKKKEGKTTDYFRNSLTVVMAMDNKKINFKISRNGKFQMTGCKEDIHAENCVKYIWEYVKNDTTGVYVKPEDESFRAIFIPAMRNIDFSLGFKLDREKLDEYINTFTQYYSLLETSIGYTGVNIKFPSEKPITDLMLKELRYGTRRWLKERFVPYKTYLDTMTVKEQQKKLDKKRMITFLVFHSGKVIMSSMCEDFAKDTYYKFLDIVRENYKTFKERLAK